MAPGRSTPLEESTGARPATPGWVTDRRDAWACLFIAFATLLVYWPVGSADFVNLDDPRYVFENPHVIGGLRWANVTWAFTSPNGPNWQPVTELSHMLAFQLFGMGPAAHHWVNLLLHVGNALLLFLVLRRATGSFWKSGFVAALFALHPLHVESVAWIVERKDVLSGLFWMLTTAAYVRYTEKLDIGSYGLALALFGLGLLAKPMLVTLPFVLLLLDYWPLRRFDAPGAATPGDPVAERARRLVAEKVPFLVLSSVVGVVTVLLQSRSAAASLDVIPFATRLANAAVSYVAYLGQTFWPFELAVFYPFPKTIGLGKALAAALLLVVASAAVLREARRRPQLAVGWWWYLGTLLPVIGLVQVGGQSMADRYTYIPLIGAFIMLAWGVPELFASWRHGRSLLLVLSAGSLLVLGVATRRQVGYWEGSESLFRRTLEVTADNARAHYGLGLALAARGRAEEAVHQYREALRIEPSYPGVHYDLGVVFEKQGRLDLAVEHYEQEVAVNPQNGRAHNNLGLTLSRLGERDAAVRHLREALRLLPDEERVRANLERVLSDEAGSQGR